MAREVDLFFMCLLAICASSFENSLFIHVPTFYWGVDSWGLSFFLIPYSVLIFVPFWVSSWQRFLSHSEGCLLRMVTVSFSVQKPFSFM
jgi:hypothetical protein